MSERKAILRGCSGESTETALEEDGIGLRIGQIVYVISKPDTVVEVAEKPGQNAGWMVLERDLQYLLHDHQDLHDCPVCDGSPKPQPSQESGQGEEGETE